MSKPITRVVISVLIALVLIMGVPELKPERSKMACTI